MSGTSLLVGAPTAGTAESGQGAAYLTDSVPVAENTTAVMNVAAFDPDVPAQTLTYSLTSDGVFNDSNLFQIDPSTGLLSFRSPPDYEAPTDFTGDNNYYVTVQVSDGLATSQSTIVVQVQNVTPSQSTVYVDSDWANDLNGTVIADADPTQAGNQPATFGVNAFANLQGAAEAVTAGGTITLLGGSAGAYSLSAALSNPFTLNVPTGAVTVSGVLERHGRLHQGRQRHADPDRHQHVRWRRHGERRHSASRRRLRPRRLRTRAPPTTSPSAPSASSTSPPPCSRRVPSP